MTGQPRFRWWAGALFVALLAPIVWLVLVADGWTVNRLVVRLWVEARWWFTGTPDDFAALLNAAMLAPSAFLASLFAPRVPWWVWGVVGFLGSSGVETVQWLYLERDGSLSDLVMNTIGAFVGAFAGHLANRWAARRASAVGSDDSTAAL